jgi:CRP/FNR family transcriptional regulator, cyclic AMP receptor protein
MTGRDEERAVKAIRRHRLFEGLTERAAMELVATGRIRSYRDRSYVTMQGDPSTEVYLLLDGRLEISTASPESRSQLKATLEPVRLVGELGVLAETERSASVLALEESRIWTLDRAAFVSFLEEQPSVALSLMRSLARQVLSKEATADDLVWLDLKGRLAKRLLQLAAPDASGEVAMVPPITQADLASLCGVTRESVSKTLTAFARRGLVRREGHRYALLDVDTLKHLADG